MRRTLYFFLMVIAFSITSACGMKGSLDYKESESATSELDQKQKVDTENTSTSED